MRTAIAILALALALAGCSIARVSTSEVQDDGSYIERGAWCLGIFADAKDGFESEWTDESTSGSKFVDRMGWSSSRAIDAESLSEFLSFAAALAKAGALAP